MNLLKFFNPIWWMAKLDKIFRKKALGLDDFEEMVG